MNLNDYSSRFLAVLAREFPALGDKAAEGPEVGCFTVEFVTSSGTLCFVATEEFGRVTVGIGARHRHFGGWADSVGATDFDDAVGYIRSLMNGA